MKDNKTQLKCINT